MKSAPGESVFLVVLTLEESLSEKTISNPRVTLVSVAPQR